MFNLIETAFAGLFIFMLMMALSGFFEFLIG